MADVDFSHATMSVNTTNSRRPISEAYVTLADNPPELYNFSGTIITTSGTRSEIRNTPSVLSYLYTGTFTASGTEFYMGAFKISGVSFSSGDTYSFIIDIETSGN